MADDKKEKKGAKSPGKGGKAPAKNPKKGAKQNKSKSKKSKNVREAAGTPRLKTLYDDEISNKLKDQFQYKNVMQIPKLKKITLNMGLGEAIDNIKILDSAVDELGTITGQKALVTKAKKSIANFKLRTGMPIGAMVTLRREAMYEFLDRLMNIALPRVRDFKGVSNKAFDGKGNYSLGLKEQIIFPEIDYDKIDKVKGLNVTIVISAKTDEEGRALLSHFGMPFRK